MPGCAAIGCNNRSEKGYSMKCFPRDPRLRQEWKERVGRANWEPSKNSFLCHDHFEPDQWAENENGRIKLKRDAMPSIFKETSTRKSPRKRRIENPNFNLSEKNISNLVQVTAVKVIEDESENDNYALEYLDDCEYEIAFSSTETPHTYSKPLNHLTTINTVDTRQGTAMSLKKNQELAYRIVSEKDMKQLEKENVIIVSDENNREIGKLVHNNESVIIVADENNKEIGQIVVGSDPLNLRNFNADSKKENSYDEIEEKLKKICNGEDVSVSITPPKVKVGDSSTPNEKIVIEKEVPTEKEVDLQPAVWTAESKLDKEIPDNLKLIFGDESGVESRYLSDDNSSQAILDLEEIGGPDNEAESTTKKIESINRNDVSSNESFPKGAASDLQNLKAAIKRQRITRGNVMRSIENAIAEISDSASQTVKNDELTRSILRIARARKKRDERKTSSYERATEVIEDIFELDSSNEKSKFTIKVTGVADDISDIFEGLETLRMKKRLINTRSESNKGDNSSRKYIVDEESFTDMQEQSMESLKSDEEFTTEIDSVDFAEECIVREESLRQHKKSNKNRFFNTKRDRTNIEMLKPNKGFLKAEEMNTKKQAKKLSNEENGRNKADRSNFDDDINPSTRFKYFTKSQDPLRDLRQKIHTQQEVIGKLTNQLIIYKGLEAKLASLNLQLQVKTQENQVLKEKLENKLLIPTYDGLSDCKKDTDIKERTISILSNRVNKLKEVNKKLMLQIASESQNKKLSHNLKQKDDQIKELNWKLEKASKFLDRAQKNANTYKRKMVSMQTSIRRQKAMEEKRNHFQELLIDNAKHEFSESALLTAMDIKNSCGIKCYQKLLSYNFPLPSLRTLRRRFQRENVTEDDWGDDDQETSSNPINQNNQVIIEVCPQNSVIGETEITGTVQDIFEEINDAEELNSSELGEHIFLQLKSNGKYTET